MYSASTIGILYPGELGAALGRLLIGNGLRVVTTLDGRSPRTSRLCRAAELTVLDSLKDVVRQANVLISVVLPDIAETVAKQISDLPHLSPPDAIYVDVNSIGPELAVWLDAKIAASGRAFVDASLRGPAGNLASGATLYLSGQRAGDVAELFAGTMRVRVLGPEPGRASAMKMILTGLPKGIAALFVEVAALAQRQGMLKEMYEEVARFNPDVLAAAERMLPTYPQHAARRAIEIRELEETCHAVGQEPCMFAAIRRLFEAFAAVPFDTETNNQWTIASIVEQLVNNEFLANGVPARPPGDF